MIVGVRGVVESSGADWLTVSVGGFMLRLHVTRRALQTADQPGSAVFLPTQLYIREDLVALYGFADEAERELFQLLLSVSGVGPRLALALLSGIDVARLAWAIERDDVAVLASVPGVGKRIATRIALELKGKLQGALPLAEAQTAGPGRSDGTAWIRVRQMLSQLGYSNAEVQEAIGALPVEDAHDIDAALRSTLQYLSDRGR